MFQIKKKIYSRWFIQKFCSCCSFKDFIEFLFWKCQQQIQIVFLQTPQQYKVEETVWIIIDNSLTLCFYILLYPFLHLIRVRLYEKKIIKIAKKFLLLVGLFTLFQKLNIFFIIFGLHHSSLYWKEYRE